MITNEDKIALAIKLANSALEGYSSATGDAGALYETVSCMHQILIYEENFRVDKAPASYSSIVRE